MKFAFRLKETTTATSMASITLAGAVTGFRSLAKVISAGASDPNALKVGDTGVPFLIEDAAGNWEESLFTITSATVLTRTSVLDSSNDGEAVVFPAGSKTVGGSVPAQWLARIATLDEGLSDDQLPAAPATIPDTWIGGVVTDPSTGTSYKATVGALKAIYGTGGNVTTPADTTAPTFVSAQVANASPSVIQITMSETLAATLPPLSALAPTKNGSSNAATAVSISGAVMSVTVTSAYANGDVIGFSYTKPSSGSMLTDTATTPNATASFGPSAVTNNVAAPNATVPGAPTIGTAVAGNGYIDVAFTAPASNGGSAILDYTATLSTGQAATGTTSPIRVAAPNGTAATATVKARNSVGSSAASAASNSVTPTAPAQTITVNTPPAQTVGTAFNVTGTFTNGTPSALDYRLSDDAAGQWTQVATATINAGAGTYSFSQMPATISAGRTISVRDRTTLVSGTSGAYAVNAAAAPTYSFVKYGTTSPVPVNSTFTMAKAYAVPAETVASGYVTVAMTAGGTVGSRPASCLHGWSNSPTVPPSQTITAAQNDGTGGASGQNNGYVPFTFNGTAYPIIAYIWQATIGTMPWYLWFKTSDGYEVCANPAAPLNITRTA